jgi:Hypoxia induced protein conserved region
MIVAALATLGVLFIGIFSMVKGGEFSKKYSNRLMQARVVLQGVALGCLALAWMSSQSQG